MKKGDKYNWKEQPERLVYLGKKGVGTYSLKLKLPKKFGAK